MMFKVGDRVKRIGFENNSDMTTEHYGMHVGDLATVKVTDLYNNCVELIEFGGSHSMVSLKLVKGGKCKPDDMVRYMALGIGCNNKGSIRESEKAIREDLKEFVKDSSWSGRIIGYKLVPLFEAKTNVRISKFRK